MLRDIFAIDFLQQFHLFLLLDLFGGNIIMSTGEKSLEKNFQQHSFDINKRLSWGKIFFFQYFFKANKRFFPHCFGQTQFCINVADVDAPMYWRKENEESKANTTIEMFILRYHHRQSNICFFHDINWKVFLVISLCSLDCFPFSLFTSIHVLFE